ncbi:MAG TPA: sodium:proton antiporter [Kofleriaceae bacterium]|nr:sodium:proton antiporter [Kofleriaceae bacterium]
MTGFQIAAVLLTLTAALAYVNARLLRLPSAIGLMATALVASLVILVLDGAGITSLADHMRALLDQVDLSASLLHGALGLLLFAGALHVDLDELRRERGAIAALAFGGTLLSTALIGFGVYAIFALLGIDVPLIQGLLFGAVVSPTDPIAVLGILRTAGAPRRLEVVITGESLFNDGLGVVIFVALLSAAVGAHPSAGSIALLFVREALGGAAFGVASGYLAFLLLRSLDQYTVEIMITLALVVGGYAAAELLHVSAPIAAVTAGLLVGNQGRSRAMSRTTRDYLDAFWEVIDEILNAMLFLLLGLEVVRLRFSTPLLAASALAVPLVLAARLASVAVPMTWLRGLRRDAPGAIRVLTWGGLRGGISVALALSLPPGAPRQAVLPVTYAVVAFSILVQGLTLGPLVRRVAAHHREAEPAQPPAS